MTRALADVAGQVGKGLAAGVAGTALMTLASTIEMKVQGRGPSSAPADAAAKVLGVEPTGEKEKARFSNVVHWAYGTSWGAFRGALSVAGLSGPAAAGAHFAAVWGSGLVMLPALGVAPPAKEWGTKALAVDAFHHIVYAAGVSLAFSALDRRSCQR